jgi:hypothetical protein
VQDLAERLARMLLLSVLNRLLAQLLLREGSSVRVESEQNLSVAQRVLLLHVGALGAGLALGLAQHGLDFGRVDQTGNVGVGQNVGRQQVVLLQSGRSSARAVDLVQSGESRRGPHDEAAQVATRSQLQQVQGVDRRRLNTRDVAESLDELLAVRLRVVDDQRTAALAVAAATHLTLTSTDLAGLLDLDQVRTSTNTLQQSNSGLGLGNGGTLEGLGFNDERNFGHVGDAVATGEKKSRNGGSSQGRGSSKTPLT